PAGRSVSMEVRVGQEVFQGAVIRYRTSAADGTELSVIAPLDERLPADRTSDIAWISWDPAYAYVLPDGDRSAEDSAAPEGQPVPPTERSSAPSSSLFGTRS